MQNLMIDLETMGTNPQAAIVAIGAVEFSLTSGELGREFYKVVDLASSMEAGGIVDPGTVLWWLRQSDEARAMFQAPAHRIHEVLESLSLFMAEFGGPDVKVWGNGAAFDNVVLAGASSEQACPGLGNIPTTAVTAPSRRFTRRFPWNAPDTPQRPGRRQVPGAASHCDDRSQMIPKPFKEGRIYHYRFRLDGRRRQRSTGETSPAKAQKVAAAAYEAALLGSRGESGTGPA